MEEKIHHIGTLSPEMTLLGLLYGAAGHGYDLHRKVTTDLGQVWHLSQSQAYAILKRLEAQGDIAVQMVPETKKHEKVPRRQLLCLTPEGKKRFLAWLDAPSGGSTRLIRMEFITRLYFLRQYMPDKLDSAFERQRQATQETIQRLQKLRQELPEGQIFNRISLELRQKQLETVLVWLDECRESFAHA